MASTNAANGENTSSEPRVSTGNANLDLMLCGGFVARRPYLLVGPGGTGKTKLALSFLCEGARRGENVLIVTLEEPPNELRLNHQALAPLLDRVFVFDAIPDVMRYERAPFKDIAAVRKAVRFSDVPLEIRKTPELTSVEVTFSALEQTLKMEIARRSYSRLVIDSLTALQFFCMKGVDEAGGAQTFLRFLTDLGMTTVLTVESPLEEVDQPERLLARGEVRLSRWEVDDITVRSIGVEKFRGSAHDIRLHPYTITPTGLAIDLQTTIARDTKRPGTARAERPRERAAARAPAIDEGAVLAAIRDLSALGLDVHLAQAEVDRAQAAGTAGKPAAAARHLQRARGLITQLALDWEKATRPDADGPPTLAKPPATPAVPPPPPAPAFRAPVLEPLPTGTPPPHLEPVPAGLPPPPPPPPPGPSPAALTPLNGHAFTLPPVAKHRAVAQPPLPQAPAAPPSPPALPPVRAEKAGEASVEPVAAFLSAPAPADATWPARRRTRSSSPARRRDRAQPPAPSAGPAPDAVAATPAEPSVPPAAAPGSAREPAAEGGRTDKAQEPPDAAGPGPTASSEGSA
jgi:KaiC/GvpD/RAD55 family RecA-like ATPase